MQRTMGMVLLSVGTGLAAVFGAWLPGSADPSHQRRMAAAAHTQMQAEVGKRLKAAQSDAAESQRLRALAALPAPEAPEAVVPPRGQAAVRLWASEAGWPFALGLLLVVVGVVLARRGTQPEADDADDVAETRSIEALLRDLADQTAALAERYPSLAAEATELPDLEALRAEVEALQRTLVAPLVERRDALSQSHGVAAFAEVYVPFAAAERLLNRSWSACVDGYVDEVGPCLARARDAADEATRAYARVAA